MAPRGVPWPWGVPWPPEVYRGPCMKITRLNTHIIFTYSQILVENRRFNLPHLSLVPPLRVTPLEFRRDLWQQKTKMIALSCDVKNIAGWFFGLGLVTKHACDGRTDGRTELRLPRPR